MSFRAATLDDLLPAEETVKINAAFPDKSTMMHRSSLREGQNTFAAQLNQYAPILEEITYSFSGAWGCEGG